MNARFLTRISILIVGLMVVAACGQKEGVHEVSSQTLPSIIIETGNVSSGGGGTGNGSNGSGGGSGGGGGGGTSTGGGSDEGAAGGGAAPTPGENEGTTGGGGGGGGGGSLQIQGSDRTGVSDDAITVAIHAPVTGAAPLPAQAFEKSRDLYWRWVTESKGEQVLGRSTVNVQFKDDKYTPQTAVQACRELAASSFLLVGGGGTDQIQACGRYSEQAGVPYLSAGVTEAGLRGLNNYFATSMSYKDQGPLLAAYVKKNFAGQKIAAIATDTPNFDDAVDGWEDGVARQGLDYYKTMRHPKGNQAWINSFISELKGEGVQVVYMLTAPTDYIQFANQAQDQEFTPQYVGVGITMGLNALFSAGCPSINGGVFFSPFPGLDYARTNIAEFFQAGEQFGVPTDDIALALWGQNAVMHEMFKRYEATFGSTDLTREDFVAMLEQQQGIQTNVFPQLSYSPDNHFGASQVHVLKANCSAQEHETQATFASGF